MVQSERREPPSGRALDATSCPWRGCRGGEQSRTIAGHPHVVKPGFGVSPTFYVRRVSPTFYSRAIVARSTSDTCDTGDTFVACLTGDTWLCGRHSTCVLTQLGTSPLPPASLVFPVPPGYTGKTRYTGSTRVTGRAGGAHLPLDTGQHMCYGQSKAGQGSMRCVRATHRQATHGPAL